MRAVRWFLALTIATSLPATAMAQVVAVPPAHGPIVDPALARALVIPAGPGLPAGHAHAVLELRHVEDLPRLTTLPGVEVEMDGPLPLHHGRWAVARIDAEGLRSLRAASFLAQVRLAPPAGRPPLDRSAERLHLSAAHAGPLADGTYGRGVLVADLDTPLDPFHPAFFHADGGTFVWMDMNGDGSLGEGDAIDLDRDGIADPDERTSTLLATPIDFYGATPSEIRHGAEFDPGIDWVFLDLDHDGVRSVGAAAGFDDATPGLGEPLFVPDDVDRDGVLEPAERVFRLSTSKVRAMRVDAVEFGGPPTTVFTRGTNLGAAVRDYTHGAYGYGDTLHGSGVAGIMIADVPLIGRRWVGIAPEAEIVLGSDIGETNFDGLMWALGHEPSVMVHEYVVWTDVLLDGSDPTSVVIDESTAEGVAHACPAGNIGGEGKHAMATVQAGAATSFPFDVSTTYIVLTLHIPLGSNPRVTLVEASGATHDFGGPLPGTLADGTDLYWQEQVGRTHRALSYFAYAPAGLPFGRWSLEVEGGTGSATVTAHAFLSDENGFARGTDFVDDSDVSTIAWPATSDGCVAVGAYPAHLGSDGSYFRGDEADGEVRGYSARGPRIDGARSIDVIAPDNPLSPLGAGDALPSQPGRFVAPEGGYQIFGGTSGAGPHVAGVLMLLSERGVHGAAARDQVIDSAIGDAIAGALPNDDYGHGRVDGAAALGVSTDGTAPHVVLTSERDGEGVRISPTVDDADGGELSVRWDLDYDGVWDTDLEAPAARTLTVPAWIKVEVQDETHRRDQAVLRIDSLGALDPDGGDTDAGASGAPGGGCGCGAARRDASPAGLAAVVLLALAARRRWPAR